MNIAIILVHNKREEENEAQIEYLKSLVNKITDINDQYDQEGNIIGTYETYHYELEGLDGYEVKFFQVIPFGVALPPNLYDIDSHKVFYGKGDEDKMGDHSRFFNWGLKRGTDYGAEAVVYLENPAKLSIQDLAIQLNSLVDPDDKHEFAEDANAKVASLKLLKEVGQLDEAKTKEQAITELKAKNKVKGNKNG